MLCDCDVWPLCREVTCVSKIFNNLLHFLTSRLRWLRSVRKLDLGIWWCKRTSQNGLVRESLWSNQGVKTSRLPTTYIWWLPQISSRRWSKVLAWKTHTSCCWVDTVEGRRGTSARGSHNVGPGDGCPCELVRPKCRRSIWSKFLEGQVTLVRASREVLRISEKMSGRWQKSVTLTKFEIG